MIHIIVAAVLASSQPSIVLTPDTPVSPKTPDVVYVNNTSNLEVKGPITGAPMGGIFPGEPLIINESNGGVVDDFRVYGLKLLAKHTAIIVNGNCYSACTLLVDVAHADVCITSNAVLFYHKQFDNKGQYDLHYETPGLKAYINSRGGLPNKDDDMPIPFEQAKQFYKVCKPTVD